MILNNKKKFIAIVSMLSLFIITLHSCNPLGSKTDSTYSLTGRMLKDCSGEPYANYSLTFYIPGDGTLTKTVVLGTVNTDDKGYFNLSNIPSNKSANVHLKHTIDANYVTTWGSFNIPDSANIYDDGAVYDLGDYYGEYTVNAIVKVFNLPQSDSLIIGYHPKHYQAFPPNLKDIVYQYSSSGSNYRVSNVSSETHLYWGAGKLSWDSLFIPNTGIELANYTIKAKLSVCTFPDTTYYSIP